MPEQISQGFTEANRLKIYSKLCKINGMRMEKYLEYSHQSVNYVVYTLPVKRFEELRFYSLRAMLTKAQKYSKTVILRFIITI